MSVQPKTLLELTCAASLPTELGVSVGADEIDRELGPSVGADDPLTDLISWEHQWMDEIPAVAARSLIDYGLLGVSVGADEVGPIDNAPLGASVCDDEGDPIDRSPLGLSVGADEGSDISDRRLKTDVRRVGSTVFGLPLYDFRYIGGKEVFRGVMAQDVLSVMPDAVATGADGFMRVRYGMLGTAMQRVA